MSKHLPKAPFPSFSPATLPAPMIIGGLENKTLLSPKFIFQIEKQGLGFSVDTLMQLTRVLETSYDYLLEGHTEF